MLYSSLMLAAILARSSVASDNSQQSPVLYKIPNDVAIIIRKFIPDKDQYALIRATEHKGYPFGCVYTEMNELIDQLCHDSKLPFWDMFYNSYDWFTLEYPVPQPKSKPRSTYTGNVDVSPVDTIDPLSRKVFCRTFNLQSWIEHNNDNYCIVYRRYGDDIKQSPRLGPFDHVWLLTERVMIGYRQKNRQLFMIVLQNGDCADVLPATTLHHDLDLENISFIYERRYLKDQGWPRYLVQIQRQNRKIEIINTKFENEQSKFISVELPEDWIIEDHYLSPAGRFIIVLGKPKDFNFYELLSISTTDGRIKSKVPLMGYPTSIKISPTDRYVLVAFPDYCNLPVHLMNLFPIIPHDGKPMLTIIPDSFGCDCVDWLNDELFKMDLFREDEYTTCVRSSNDPSSDLVCSVDASSESYAYNDNGAKHVYDLDTVYYPGMLHHRSGIIKFQHLDWKTVPKKRAPLIYHAW